MKNIFLLLLLFCHVCFAADVEVKLVGGKIFKGSFFSENQRFLVIAIKESHVSLCKDLIETIDGVPYHKKSSQSDVPAHHVTPASIPNQTSPSASMETNTAQDVGGNSTIPVAVTSGKAASSSTTLSIRGKNVVVKMKNGQILRGIVSEETRVYYLITSSGKEIFCNKNGVLKIYTSEEEFQRDANEIHGDGIQNGISGNTAESGSVDSVNTTTDTANKWANSNFNTDRDVNETIDILDANSSYTSETLKEKKKSEINSRYLYVNFCSGGVNFCNVSKKYSDLLGNYYGYELYQMLGGAFTVDPESKLHMSGNCFLSLGFYPRSFVGINLGFGFLGQGDKVLLIDKGNEEINVELNVKYLQFPVFVRLMTPDNQLAGYFDLGISYGRAVAGTEKMIYEYDGSGQSDYEAEDWIDIDIFDATNEPYYNRDAFSLIMGLGLHAEFVFIDYRVFIGLSNLTNNENIVVESKFVTHTINIGFDYYFKLKKNKK